MDEVYMADNHPNPDRPWREIAEEVTSESDSDKVIELSEELVKALTKQQPQQTPEHDEENRPAGARLRGTPMEHFNLKAQIGYPCTKWRYWKLMLASYRSDHDSQKRDL